MNADVPWAMAGPSGADPLVRHYSHDAWNSVSCTINLPAKGAVMGALAPVLTPSEAGERRCFLVAYPILRQTAADRRTANSEWAADLGEELRHKAKIKQRARSRDETAKARGVDAKLARGNALTRPYAVCTVTVPKTARIAEFGRRLDASVRRAGFAPLRLDLAHDVGVRRLHRPPRRQPDPPGTLMTGRTPRPQARANAQHRGRDVARLLADFGHDLPAAPSRSHSRPKRLRLFQLRPPRRLPAPRPRLGGREGAGVDVADDLRPGAGAVAVHLHPRPAADRSPDGHRHAVRRLLLRRPVRLGPRTTRCRSPTPTCSSSANPAAASPPR